MNKKYILFFLFGLLSITISAQRNSSRHNLAMEITTYGTVYVAWKPANPQKP